MLTLRLKDISYIGKTCHCKWEVVSLIFPDITTSPFTTSFNALFLQNDAKRMQAADYRLLGIGLAGFSLLCGIAFSLIDSRVVESYMDEVFHIPQAVHYCKGEFAMWNSKITTFPGLYFFSAFLHWVFGGLGIFTPFASILCTTSSLRSTNLFFAIGNFATSYLLLRTMYRNLLPSAVLIRALTVAFLPILFFFNFLYYTDGGSLFFVLATYYFAVKQVRRIERTPVTVAPSAQRQASLHFKANVVAVPLKYSSPYSFVDAALMAFLGAAAVFFRQTNIVWLGFCVGIILLADFERHETWYFLRHKTYIESQRKSLGSLIGGAESSGSDVMSKIVSLLDFVALNPLALLKHFPSFVVMAGFVLFILKNGSVVIGDKANHIVSFHGPQLLYCAIFALPAIDWQYLVETIIDPIRLVFLPIPVHLRLQRGTRSAGFSSTIVANTTTTSVVSGDVKTAEGTEKDTPVPGVLIPQGAHVLMLRLIGLLIAGLFMTLMIRKGTIVHPFLLADNRHYMFYIWRATIAAHESVKLALIPLYLFAFAALSSALSHKTAFFRLFFLLCTAAAVCLSPLIEPRYFIIPIVLFFLTQRPYEDIPEREIVRDYGVLPTIKSVSPAAAPVNSSPPTQTKTGKKTKKVQKLVENSQSESDVKDSISENDLVNSAYAPIRSVVMRVEACLIQHEVFLGVRFLSFLAANVVLLYIFVFRPFAWDDGSIARFMW